MSIPRDLQRRFEQRWAARFALRVVSTRPKSIVLKSTGQNPRALGKDLPAADKIDLPSDVRPLLR